MKKSGWIMLSVVCILFLIMAVRLNRAAKNRELLQSIRESDVQAVSDAIHDGADVNAYDRTFQLFADDKDPKTPLLIACSGGKNAEQIVHQLLLAGADPNKASPGTKETPLLAAAIHGYFSIAHELVNYGADINAISENASVLSATLLGQAEHERINPDTETHHFFCFLLAHGATTNCPAGRTILHYAVFYGDQFAVEYLLKKTVVDVNQKDSKGKTALDYAKEQNAEVFVDLLSANRE